MKIVRTEKTVMDNTLSTQFIAEEMVQDYKRRGWSAGVDGYTSSGITVYATLSVNFDYIDEFENIDFMNGIGKHDKFNALFDFNKKDGDTDDLHRQFS